jgi:4-amino-4-deoxy-L-arabinose transferase-like glycosyltransferase
MQEQEKIIEERKNKLKNKFFSWIKNNYDKAFLAVLICAFVIRLIIFLKTLNQPLWWDTATYLATAKKWGLGLNVTDVWYYRRGFFWPLFGAIFYKFNLGETGLRFATVLFSTGIVATSYLIIKEMFNKKLALLTSIGVSLSWVYLFFTGRPMTSIPATFFLLTSLLFFWKGYVLKKGNKYNYLFGLFYALAILTRMQYLMFVPVFILFALLKERLKFIKNKQLWGAVGVFFVALIPHIILYWKHYGNPLVDLLGKYLGVGPVDKSGKGADISRLFDYFLDLPYAISGGSPSIFAKLIFILFIVGIFYFLADLVFGFDKILKNNELQKKLFVFLWIVIPFLFLGFITNLVEQRYIMPIIPFIFLIASIAVFNLVNLVVKNVKINKRYTVIIAFIILTILFIPNFTFGDKLIDSKITSYGEVMQAGIWMKENSDPGDIVISASYPQIAYYSERPTFTFQVEGNPEEKKERTKEEFEEFIMNEKPKYLMISAFQPHVDWAYNYPVENNQTWTPIQGYSQGDKPVLVIYKSNF